MISLKAIPGAKFDVSDFAPELEKALNEQGKKVKDDFDKTTATWKDKPNFATATPLDGQREVSTTHEVYGYINDGTPAHLISPKPGGVLAFQGVYSVKTMPGVIGSLSGGASGEMVFTRLPVLHPGTKPRKFDETIAKKFEPLFEKALEAAIDRAARKIE